MGHGVDGNVAVPFRSLFQSAAFESGHDSCPHRLNTSFRRTLTQNSSPIIRPALASLRLGKAFQRPRYLGARCWRHPLTEPNRNRLMAGRLRAAKAAKAFERRRRRSQSNTRQHRQGKPTRPSHKSTLGGFRVVASTFFLCSFEEARTRASSSARGVPKFITEASRQTCQMPRYFVF